MKRRIFLFHTLTLVAALVILLAVSGGVVRWVMDAYQRQDTPSADQNMEQARQAIDEWDTGNWNWEGLDRMLREADYRLVVQLGWQVVYSSLDQYQQELYLHTADGAVWPAEGSLMVQVQGNVLIGRRSGDFTLVAMKVPDAPEVLGRPRPRPEATVLVVLISGAAAIGVIVLLSLIFTHYQVRGMLRPVNALIQAARRMEQGDFSTPIQYAGHDEFAPVCAAFDHMQRHLLEEREKNAHYEQARTDLVAGISHDLRTPLTSVKGYLKGMRDGVANTPEKRTQYLDIAYRKACDMERLLQRLFYFSKLETGNLPLFLSGADLGEFVEQFARETGQELAPAGGQVAFRCTAGPCPVRIDPEQMLRVLTNLKENAVRYAGVQPLVLTLTVWRQPERACIRFADNGHGVPEEQLPHLFEQFWRGDQARSSQGGEGSGLGLYIVKYIVEAHGGTVRARNDNGLVFELALPLEEVRRDEQNSDCRG